MEEKRRRRVAAAAQAPIRHTPLSQQAVPEFSLPHSRSLRLLVTIRLHCLLAQACDH